MKFRNAHDLLAYLVRLDDTDDRWRLTSGQQLADHLRIEGHLDITRPEQEYAELGRMLWSLKEDGSITFRDTAASHTPGGRRGYAGFTMDDVWKFADIEVRTQGRMAVNADRPTVAINIDKLDILAILARMEQDVDQLPIDDAMKAETKTKLRTAMEVLGDVGKATLAETFAAAIRQTTGLP